MKDNRYTRALGMIEPSRETVENGISRAKSAADRRERKVLYMKNWKKAAAAACMAVVIGVGGVMYGAFRGSGDGAEHSFIITANAEEMKRDVRLEVDELSASGGGVEFIEEDKALGIEQGVPFNIRVEGEDIESVTFSTEKYASEELSMKFMLRNDFASLTENNGTDNRISEHSYIPNCTGATEFTVPYEYQLTDEQFEPYADINGDESLSHAWYVPLELYVIMERVPAEGFYAEHPDYKNDRMPDILHNAISENFSSYFNENSDKARVTVTVNYKDGSVQTEVIQLYCELCNVEDGSVQWCKPVLYASLLDD